MGHIILTVASYLLFNIAVWISLGKGGLPALAMANILGGIFTTIRYRQQIRDTGMKPNIKVALLGAIGIGCIVFGLRGAHQQLPVSISMELVYNSFAVSSWPLFVLLNVFWAKYFTERPNDFDLMCHGVMAIFVFLRIWSYNLDVDTIVISLPWVGIAVLGYVVFNLSIKLGRQHRATNIAMNLSGGVLLFIMAFLFSDFSNWQWWTPKYMMGAILGGIAIYGIVSRLGASYAVFTERSMSSLVAPLVYDGILVASPMVMVLTREQLSWPTVIIAAGMLLITAIRYKWHKTIRD